ncbi:MAG: HpaII family restriction endonuclease [Oscillospiraceae bacterium]|nr:HpaII family restriction endonuclease [Oscillospiraceae bacterium]
MEVERLNKGEWSEVYAFIKIASDGLLDVGDSDLQVKTNESYKVFRIIKDQDDRIIEIEDNNVVIKNISEQLKLKTICKKEFKKLSDRLLNMIIVSNEKTFEYNEIKNFFNYMGIKKLKGKCDVKSDIILDLQKNIDIIRRILSFSIKSQIGNPATILNASQKTNFVYDIVGVELNDEEINELNLKNPKIIINKVMEKGGELKYLNVNDKTFENNIKSIDFLLSDILSQLIVYTYRTSIKGIQEVLESIDLTVPNGYSNKQFHLYVLKRLKELIYLSATTMITNDDFYNGDRINGGIIIVKFNGQLVCYDLYNIDDFKNYLYKNIKFESASRKRHNYGKIYRDDNKLKIKLNLQIRYKF